MIRRATSNDALAIADLDSKVFEDCLGLEFIQNDLSTNPMAYYFVDEEDEKIVGYINCWVSDNTTILNFCVDENYRNKGIGSLLFNEVLKVYQGYLTLEVRESNINAINFYKNRSFKNAAIRKNYYSNGENAILMIRK